jgi:uncharacterized protein
MNQNAILEKLKNKDCSIALIGATNDSSKYGNIIYRDLKLKKRNIFPINPKAKTVAGDIAYPDIESLGFVPDIINFVVPPKIGFVMVKELVLKHYDFFWFQPGAESDEILSFLESNDKHFLAYSCVMVESN